MGKHILSQDEIDALLSKRLTAAASEGASGQGDPDQSAGGLDLPLVQEIFYSSIRTALEGRDSADDREVRLQPLEVREMPLEAFLNGPQEGGDRTHLLYKLEIWGSVSGELHIRAPHPQSELDPFEAHDRFAAALATLLGADLHSRVTSIRAEDAAGPPAESAGSLAEGAAPSVISMEFEVNRGPKRAMVAVACSLDLARQMVSLVRSTESRPAESRPAGARRSVPEKQSAGTGSGQIMVPKFMPLHPPAKGPARDNTDLIRDVPIRVTVELGRTTMTLKEITELDEGSVVELEKLAGEPVDIFAGDKLVARGEVVIIDESFGVKITRIVSPRERVQNSF